MQENARNRPLYRRSRRTGVLCVYSASLLGIVHVLLLQRNKWGLSRRLHFSWSKDATRSKDHPIFASPCPECIQFWSKLTKSEESSSRDEMIIRSSLRDLIERQRESNENQTVLVEGQLGNQLCNRLRLLVATICYGIVLRGRIHVSFRQGYFAEFSSLFKSPLQLQSSARFSSPASLIMRIPQDKGQVCPDLFAYSKIVLAGSFYWTILLFLNKKIAPHAIHRLGNLNGVFRRIFSNLFIPSEDIIREVKSFRQRAGFQGKYVIGIHLRSGRDFRSAMVDTDWDHFAGCANLLEKSAGKLEDETVWFIATDTQSTRDEVMRRFPNSSKKIFFFNDRFQRANSLSGVKQALVDLIILVSADARVLTPASSYSEFAYIMSKENSDNVFVHSTNSNAPSMTYGKYHKLSPWCWTPTVKEPSVHELRQIIHLHRHSCNFSDLKQSEIDWDQYNVTL
eukprot:764557-Hanusia_phi.AAC.1